MRATQFRHDAFEALGRRRLEEGLAFAFDVAGIPHPRMRPKDALQQALPILEGDPEQRAPVQIEQIERLVDEAARRADAEPLLEQAEIRSAGLVEGHDLAIDDGLRGLDPRGRAEQAGEIGLRVLQVAGPLADLPVADDSLDPEAVPLDLEQPVRVVEGVRGEGREHRFDVLGHGRRDRAREIDLGSGGGRLAVPQGVAVGLDVVVGPSGLDALRVVLGVPAGARDLVPLVDEQPLVALVVLEGTRAWVVRPAPAPARPHDREAPLQLLAVEAELELAIGDGAAPVERRRLGCPGAPVPDDDVAGAVLLGRDHALEVEVLDRVVLDVDGHPAHAGVEGRALRDGP